MTIFFELMMVAFEWKIAIPYSYGGFEEEGEGKKLNTGSCLFNGHPFVDVVHVLLLARLGTYWINPSQEINNSNK